MHRVLISGKGGQNLADLPLSAPWVTVHDETVCTPVRDTVNNTGEREGERRMNEEILSNLRISHYSQCRARLKTLICLRFILN